MKKAAPTKSESPKEDMLPEYSFDRRRTRPNRFAAALPREVIAVVLDPDVAAIFRTTEAVNQALRSVIAALPEAVRDNVSEYAKRPAAKRRG